MAKPLVYFSYQKSFEENKKSYRTLSMKHHPDKPTGNEEVMKAINDEWETYEKNHKTLFSLPDSKTIHPESAWESIFAHIRVIFPDEDEEEDELEYIMFKGSKYLVDENILETIARRHGGMGLLEFLHSKAYQDYINKK